MNFEPDHYRALARQALRRDLSQVEISLATALEDAFRNDIHDLESVAQALNVNHTARPSGKSGPWTDTILVEELKMINDALDVAYRNAPPISRYSSQRPWQGE
ncbi:recombinase-like helix-turn-helix domain-containing protein [Bradyrhizobium sp. RDM4]|uniref:recombinase-like helix-turn-helix domain-containing protein n=1 Tax=Bradyrhizobium sp. RDM4 TaxID=3378765 RepID=UPI0038FC7B64